MAITNVGSTQSVYSSATPVTSHTFSAATGSRTNGVLGVITLVISGSNVTGVTFDGNALAQAVETNAPPAAADIWYLFAPTFAGGTHDVVVTFAGNTQVFGVFVFWADSDSVLEIGNTATSTAGTDPQSVSVTAVNAGELIVSGYVSSDNNVATATAGTLLQEWDQGGNVTGSSYLIAAGTGSQTLTWDRAAAGQANPFNIAAAAFRETTVNDPPVVTLDSPADTATVTDATPDLDFTGTDEEGNPITYELQVSVDNTFPADGGASHTAGSGANFHPQPMSGTTWQGNSMIDDRMGCTFVGDGSILARAIFGLSVESDSPDGTAIARIYATQDAGGGLYEPLNAADAADTPTPGWLAESDGVVIDGTSVNGNFTFEFTGADRIELENGVVYMVILDWVVPPSTAATNTFSMQGDSGLGYSGNTYIDGNGPNNGTYTVADLKFTVVGEFVVVDAASDTDSGFTNLDDGGDSDPFTSGEQIRYTVPTDDALLDGLTYYWRVRGADPAGSGAFGDWTTTRSFTIDTGGGMTYEDSLGLGRTGGISIPSLLIAGGELSLSKVGSVAQMGSAFFYNTLSLNGSKSVFYVGGISVDDSVSLRAIRNVLIRSQNSVDATLSLPRGVQIVLGSNLVVSGNLTIGGILNIAQESSAVFESGAGIGKTQNIDIAGAVLWLGNILINKEQNIAVLSEVDSDVDVAIGISKRNDLLLEAAAIMGGDVFFRTNNSIDLGDQLSIDADVSVAKIIKAASVGGLLFVDNIALGNYFNINSDFSVTIEGEITLNKSENIALATELSANATLAIMSDRSLILRDNATIGESVQIGQVLGIALIPDADGAVILFNPTGESGVVGSIIVKGLRIVN